MKTNSTIQKNTALFLLLLFTIGITPKSYFHDLVANHKDFSTCHQLHKSTVLHQQGYNCHFDDLVVSAPFLLPAAQPVIFDNLYFEKKQSSFYSSFLQPFFQHKESRGPPQA